jgi:hypothetical protein
MHRDVDKRKTGSASAGGTRAKRKAVSLHSLTRAVAGFCFAAAAATSAGCTGPAILTQQVEARRVASDLRAQFAKATEAANRAVMADTDEASAAAAQQAEQASTAAQRDVEQLQTILQSLSYAADAGHLETFKARFAEYLALDREILPLAVENTNLKAQRLSFGGATEAADAFRDDLEAAVRPVTSKSNCCVAALVAQARAAVLEVQVIEARHIAESDDAAMSRMEVQMAASKAVARKTLETIRGLLSPAAGPQLAAAAAALDRFKAVDAEIVRLSRRNSNVRSLALSLGRKRTVTAECDDALDALEAALAKHEFKATR